MKLSREFPESTDALDGAQLLAYLQKGRVLDKEPSLAQLTALFEAAGVSENGGDAVARGVAAVALAVRVSGKDTR